MKLHFCNLFLLLAAYQIPGSSICHTAYSPYSCTPVPSTNTALIRITNNSDYTLLFQNTNNSEGGFCTNSSWTCESSCTASLNPTGSLNPTDTQYVAVSTLSDSHITITYAIKELGDATFTISIPGSFDPQQGEIDPGTIRYEGETYHLSLSFQSGNIVYISID